MATRRPNPVLWLYYQYGGRLPAQYREWVLHDGTCRTWLVRAIIRGIVRVLPLIAALLVFFRLILDGPWLAAGGAVVLGFLVGLRYAVSHPEESIDARLARHGYPYGYGTKVRREARRTREAAARQRYEATWRKPLR